MLNLLLSPQSKKDLEDIYKYTLMTWGLVQAEKYQDELYTSMLSVLSNPKIGALYYFKAGNYRTLKCNRHLVFYRIESENCIVVRILHERMDLTSHLK